MSGRLEGRGVVVCGGATGIGRSIAERVAAEGARLWIQYRTRATEAAALAAELRAGGARVDVVQADLTVEADVRRLLADVGDCYGLVHSVSAPLPAARFDRLPWDVYQSHFDVAVRSAYLLLQSALARPTASLRSAVFVLSSATLAAPPADWAPYLVAKHALWGLVRAAAVELGPRGVRVNGVSPSFTSTPLTSAVDERVAELFAKGSPLRRLATGSDTAAAVAYLLSDDAAYVTGVNLPVSGGLGI